MTMAVARMQSSGTDRFEMNSDFTLMPGVRRSCPSPGRARHQPGPERSLPGRAIARILRPPSRLGLRLGRRRLARLDLRVQHPQAGREEEEHEGGYLAPDEDGAERQRRTDHGDDPGGPHTVKR